MRHPRQESNHHAEGHSTGKENPRRRLTDSLKKYCCKYLILNSKVFCFSLIRMILIQTLMSVFCIVYIIISCSSNSKSN